MATEDRFTGDAIIAFFDVVGRAARQIPDEHRDRIIDLIGETLRDAYESAPDIREDVIRLHARFVSALVDPA